jgi:serine/threonine-protein kinase
VQARAAGYQDTAKTAVLITSGQDAVHNMPMLRASGTGLRVKAEGTGLMLFIDGREVGPLPQELNDLSPGEHHVKVMGEHFETWQQSVTVKPDEMLTLGPLKLKVVKGLAMIRDGGNASDARVVLESGDDRRSLPSLPINLHIDTSKPHALVATKKGFEPFRQEMVFEDGVAERTFEIALVPQKDAEEEGSEEPKAKSPRRRARTRSVAPPSTEETTGTATLSFNSIPSSVVVLDGRALGNTPKAGISVSAGNHTVVFIYKEQRVTKGVKLAPGEQKTLTHRF